MSKYRLRQIGNKRTNKKVSLRKFIVAITRAAYALDNAKIDYDDRHILGIYYGN